MKKMISLLLTVMLICGVSLALADSRITVSSIGEVLVPADTAVVSIGVNARDKDVLKAQSRVNDRIAAIRTALMDSGIEEENINTDYINIYAIYNYEDDFEQVGAYNANSSLAVKVTDMTRVGEIIDIAFEAGANTLGGISFSATDTTEAEKEALTAAVAKAREKAEILAAASGMKITGIETLQEGGTYSYDSGANNFSYKLVTTDEADSAAGTVVRAAKLVVTANVTIVFSAEE